ncbi:MAG: hypothetical protein QXT73_01325 [Candidatus Methanomethylicaceae archaeon]
MATILRVGQGITKDCVVGDKLMNRYAIFNGLERPRLITSNLTVDLLGYTPPTITSVTSVSTSGSLENGKWYAYRAVYASSINTRPVAVGDASENYTRGNPSGIKSAQAVYSNSSMSVVVQRSTNIFVTHILLYRSKGASSQVEAEAGPFYLVQVVTNPTSGSATIVDGTSDSEQGMEVETDNYAPNAYRYAIAAFGYIFAGGNYVIGPGYTCTVTNGSSYVTASAPIFYDGIQSWLFHVEQDTTGGVDGAGMYYANYVNSLTVQLVDANGNPFNYTGTSGSGKSFKCYLPGYVLRWSKYGEPESWPATNAITFEGDITGIAHIPNQSLLLVCTDSPSMWILDLTLVGTVSFKTTRRMISNTISATSHYSLVPVGNAVRGIDANYGCIFETNGVTVQDLTSLTVPRIWRLLDKDANKIKLWHCAYDARQKIFGAFVALATSHRTVDFCIGQNTITGAWFFNFEKDLLCTGSFTDPQTGEFMVLGGTEGLIAGGGAVWGRIWAPDVWGEWIPSGSLYQGTVVSATANSITVDTTNGTFPTTGSRLAGRWVLVCDENGENAQLGYIASNTSNTLTIETVLYGASSSSFNPVPSAGWRFFVGLIEVRWGPKRFNMEDPDLDKVPLEVHLSVKDFDENNPPFIRCYKGDLDQYDTQHQCVVYRFRSGDVSGNLYSRLGYFTEPASRIGIAVVDRSYRPTELRSVTLVFHTVGSMKRSEGGGNKR